jgi:hypothetical protein
MMPKNWSVTVTADGEDILRLSSGGLCGREDISNFAPIVRECANHLLAFIGPPQPGDEDYLAQPEAGEE